MDVGKLLKNVHSLNDYISTTQDASEKCKNSKIQLNMSTVLALKKIRSLEIEYFNKCEENGIACVIFERMLCLPPSKTWGVLSKELVNLLQYWLDAIRKHLVRHNPQWWNFMKLLLRFVKEIRQKDVSIPNILVEYTAECLLDLATSSRPDATQRHEILHCFNMYCSESSREIRFALRNKFGQYFVKLSSCMASCGHLPTQYSIMETLLRWLLPRQDRSLRISSAAKWFPTALFAASDVDIFLERPWVNFFQDARDFLNAHNHRHDHITSVVCRKLTVGKVVIISSPDGRQDSWLDINCVSRSVSVLLDPRALGSAGAASHKSFETLLVAHDNTHSAKLTTESLQLVLSVRTLTPPKVLPSGIDLGEDVSCDVTAVVTSRCDVKRLDGALRRVFEDKYEVLLDVDKELELSPLKAAEPSNKNGLEEDARFSHPVEVKRRKHSGYIVKPRQPVACMSPSTASTSSLAQLHEKLAALPRYKYDKEPVSVCAHPELSIVTEYSEADDRQSLNTTLKYKPYGVCYKNFRKLGDGKLQSDVESRIAQIDLEARKSQSDPETSRKVGKDRRLSPVVNEKTPSCLLVATIGSTDDSVINDTVERLSKTKDYSADNIVDLLVKEALQAKYEDKDKSDSGINTEDKKSDDPNENSETIDNTPNVDEIKVNKLQKKASKVVSSTSDESNTEAINETPSYVSTRKKNKKEIPKATSKRDSFDEQVVEEFFSQHFTENKVGEIVISPTLAKKINETSSETSDNFGENFNLIGEDLEADIVPYDFNNLEVLECLNNMVDKVCDEFDKCSKYLTKDFETTSDADDFIQKKLPLQDIMNTIQAEESTSKETPKKSESKKKIKLKYKITPKKAKARAAKRKNKLELEPTSKMSTIIEDKGLESAAENAENNATTEPKKPIDNEEKSVIGSPPNDAGESKTPQTRKKRKLYSPKDEQIVQDSVQAPEDEIVLSELKIKQTPKSTATCYKQLEKDRQRYYGMPRSRKSRQPDPPSPRTKKMNDVFDKIKKSANSEKVTLADKTFEADVYNFTSDSDDDFKEKKIEVSKRTSTTTIGSFESAVSKRGRAVKRINYTDNKSSDESNKGKRKVARKPRTKKKANIERSNLVDERMRKAKDELNTSMIVEKTKTTVNEPEPVIEIAPEMEVIDVKVIEKPERNLRRKGKKNKPEAAESKRTKRVLSKPVIEVVKNVDEDRTESPLPGLLVEPVPVNKEDTNELPATMIDKFKKIYQAGPENYINESNTTQNLLSDIERINYSPPTVDITEEFIQIDEQLQNKPNEKPAKTKKLTIVKAKSIKKERNTKSKNSDTENVVINISTITDIKSEKSIETIGITGHGELEELPPSPKLINERLEPRNLDVEDLDHSMKDYFDKLTKDMNESNNRDSSGSNQEQNRKTRAKSKSNGSVKSNSPVVSIKRLSFDDISRWLPSRRNSDSDQTYASAKSAEQQQTGIIKLIDSPKFVKSKENRPSEICEINEPKRQSMRLIYKNDKINNSGQSNHCASDSESSSDSPIFRKLRSRTNPKEELNRNAKSQEPDKKTKQNRSSLISPIKLFEDLISNADKHSEITLSDDEEYMKDIIHTLSKKKKDNLSKQKTVKDRTDIVFEQKNTSKSIETLSNHSKMSTSTKKDDSRMILKRRSEDDREDVKKKKAEVNNNVEDILGSGVTVSSVDDWFKRIEPGGSRDEMLSASVKHSMQHVMERLDTTLVEIHRSTSKKFVHLFVDAQKNLCQLKEERRDMYKTLASHILNDIVKIIDEKFADLDKRSQELDGNFMKQLKERASELIREDCKQKRAMVRLLKEDVQAVLEHMDRQGHSV